MLSSIAQDLRYAARQLTRSPGFALAAILTFGLGIGATTAIFSVVNALLLRPPPGVEEFDRVVSLYTSDYSGPPFGASSLADLRDFGDGVPALSGVAGHTIQPTSFNDATGTSAAEMMLGQVVTPNYFDVLGATPALGRTFVAGEGTPAGQSDVVVLGNEFWRTRFGADPGIVGSTVRLAGQPYTVIGVVQEGFRGLLPGVTPAFFVPTGAPGLANPRAEDRGSRGFLAFGRLADGATIEQASRQLEGIAAGLHEAYPAAWTNARGESRAVSLLPARETLVPPQVRGPAFGFAALLLAISAGVLLIASANIANLLLVRATDRRREIGVRLAIGASRRRIGRQLLTESITLAGLGAVLGFGIAIVATRALTSFATGLPLPFSVRLDIAPDYRVLAFAAAVTIVAGVVSGFAPALVATRKSLSLSMRREEPRNGRIGLKAILSAGQIAVAMVLLVTGGLLVRSLFAANSTDVGFRLDGLGSVSVGFDEQSTDADERLAFQRRLLERVGGLPGIESASYASSLPLTAGTGRRGFRPIGYSPAESEEMEMNFADVGADYFRVMGTRLVEGREFEASDRMDGPPVAIVNETFARRYLQGQDPLGSRLVSGPDTLTVVGVAQDGTYVSLSEESLPFVWRAAEQFPPALGVVVVRTTREADPVLAEIRSAIAEVDPDVAITGSARADQHLSFVLLPQRTGAWLLGMLGLVGLGLAALGVYGVMSYSVNQRRREYGIRLALGARPDALMRMVIRQGMAIAMTGALVGLVIALGIGRLIGFLLYGVEPIDPLTFSAVAALVFTVALLANWIPARRPARSNPADAMQLE